MKGGCLWRESACRATGLSVGARAAGQRRGKEIDGVKERRDSRWRLRAAEVMRGDAVGEGVVVARVRFEDMTGVDVARRRPLK